MYIFLYIYFFKNNTYEYEQISKTTLSIFSGSTDIHGVKIFTGDNVRFLVDGLVTNYKCHYSTFSSAPVALSSEWSDVDKKLRYSFYLKNTFNNSDIDILKSKNHIEVVKTEKHKFVEIFERDKKINLILNFKK